jgi:hypothetical protein
MKIDFCDLCNESVPLSDLESGRAVRIKGRVVCSRCDQIMHARAMHEVALPGVGSMAALATAGAPPLDAPVTALPAPSVASPWAAAPLAPDSPRGAGALALAAVALLGALGIGYWLYDRSEKETRAQQLRWADLRSELAELRAESEALSVTVEQRSTKDLHALEQKVEAGRQQVEGLLASARQDTQAVAGRIAEIEQRVAVLQETGGSDERQDGELRALQQKLAQVGTEVEQLGRALADVASEHANALAAVAEPAPAQPAWMGLVAKLSSADEGDRWSAVISLGETRDPAVSPYLLPVLKDEDIFVRMAAARTLGDLRAPEAVPALIDALADAEPSVREAVYTALKAITKRDMAFDALGEDEDQRTRQIQVWRDWWAKEQARQGG